VKAKKPVISVQRLFQSYSRGEGTSSSCTSRPSSFPASTGHSTATSDLHLLICIGSARRGRFNLLASPISISQSRYRSEDASPRYFSGPKLARRQAWAQGETPLVARQQLFGCERFVSSNNNVGLLRFSNKATPTIELEHRQHCDN
jgi:hypothetical protein